MSHHGDTRIRHCPHAGRDARAALALDRVASGDEKGAREELKRSLDRLGVDHVDLWQLHSLSDPIEWDQALSPGGALDAAQRAREEGLIKWIGVTGHGAQIAATHRRSLDRFDFDSVLLPYNYVTMQSSYYRENFDALAKTCAERNAAVQTIKSIAMRPWMQREHTRTTWYQPLEDLDDIDAAVWWALGRPGIFVNTVGDVDLLPLVLDAASRIKDRPSDDAMRALVRRTQTEPLFV